MGKANVPNRDKNLFIKQQHDYKISSVLYQRKSERMILERKKRAYYVYASRPALYLALLSAFQLSIEEIR
ncbi:hypothetical protein Sbal625DRAFT_0390 [Shewanella baltica OS625]|nr:hypothetical protein Sbal678_3873 [Shewanella baltica OS678]EHC08058.1 hypothetical protein Sbal625DRAFT_0390 [Shewanella baltica OS625]MCS6178754.1 hypothetical protein [Shewanella baltica]MCS6254820.1 hypothetical protein [Shewanella baltica]